MTRDVKEPGASLGKAGPRLFFTVCHRHPRLGCVLRYGLSAAWVLAGIGAWQGLYLAAGSPMPEFITLYPVVMAVAVLAGLGPGLLATGLAALAAAHWILPPEGFAVGAFADRLALGLFTGIGLAINVLAERSRRNRRQVAVFERERALHEGQERLVEAALKAANDELGAKVQERTAALKEANSYNRSLLEANLDPLVTIGPDGTITDVNAATEAVTGHSRSELIGTDFLNYFTEPELARAGYMKVFQEGWVRNYPLEIRHRDGHTVPVMYNATVYRDENGKVTGVFADARDISEQKRAEAALKAERERLYAVLETLPVYVVLLSKDYSVPFANRFFRERFGESGGRRCFEYLFNRTEPCEDCESFKALTTNAHHNWQWAGPDGRNYDIHDYPFTDHDGSTLVLEMGIDVTATKQAQTKLKQANETLEQRVAERTAQLGAANEELLREVAERKRTEEVIRTSEAKYRSLFENMVEGFALYELLYDEQGRPCDWRVLEVNDAYTRNTGIERQRIAGRRVSELFPAAVPEYLPIFAHVVESQKPADFDTYSKYVDRHLHVVAYPAGGNFFASIIEDIGVRKQSQLERDVSILFLRMVNASRSCSELLKAAVIFFKEHSGCDAVGVRLKQEDDFPYQETLGFSKEFLEAERSLCACGTAGESCLTACMCGQVISGNKAFSELSLTAHGSFWSNDTAELLQIPSSPHNPIRGRCVFEGYGSIALLPLHKGSERIGLLQLNARRKEAFSPVGISLWERLADHLAVAVSKFQAEESLRKSETRFHSVFDHAATGIAVTDCAGRFIQCNEAYSRLLGYTQEELAALTFPSLIHPADREYNMVVIRQLLEGEIPSFEIENRYLHKAGGFVWVHKYVSLLHDDDGHPTHIVALVTDTTERKQTEDTLRFLGQCDANAFEDDFFRNLARYLAQTLNMDYICIDRLESDLLLAHTLAVFHNGQFEDNVQYALKDTPCGAAAGKPICSFPQHVRSLFPKDEVLKELRAESYLGATLWSSQGKPIGLIAAVGRAPLTDTRRAEALLQLVAVRASGELERQQAEAALRESRESLSRAQEVAHVGSWRLNIQRNELLWSDECCRIFGIPKDTPLTYETFLRTIHPADRAYVNERWSAAVRGEPYDIEHRIIVGDTVKWVRERAELDFDGDGKLLGGFGIAQDITDRKNAEVVKARYELIAKYARDPLLLLGLDGNIMEANQAAVQLYGYPREELIGLRLYVLSRDDAEVVDLQMQQALAEGVLFETAHVRKDGSLVPVEVSSRGVVIAGEELLLSVIRDVSTRKETERTLRLAKEEAERASQAKSDFLASMSHELRTPLNAIMGFSQVLENEYFGPMSDKQKEYASDIYESGKHLLSLINDILDLSKIEAGKMEPQWSRIQVDGLLEQSRTLVREKCFKHGISLDFEAAPQVRGLAITADERRLKQILYNLLSNATKFTPDGGSIRVRAKLTEESVPMLEVSVADTGIGIAPEHQPLVFEAFYQVHYGTVNKTPGTGLGLCLVRQLVALHGGRIWVESGGEGHGSCFTFVIPLDARSAVSTLTTEDAENETDGSYC